MRLSVIIPYYNGEKFITQAIRSFIEQHMEDAELILVDDGSTDHIHEILARYSYFQNLKYFRTENRGAAAARNFGMLNARGNWIVFLDQDDLLLPNSLTYILDTVDLNGEIIFTPKCFCDVMLTKHARIIMPEKLKKIKHHIPATEFWVCIVKRQFLINEKIHFYEGMVDVESSFRYQLFSKSRKVIRITDKAFYLQRNNLNSSSHTWNKIKLLYSKASIYFDLYSHTIINADKNYLLKVAYFQYLEARKHHETNLSSDDCKVYEELMRLGVTMEQSISTTPRAIRIAAMRIDYFLCNGVNYLRKLKNKVKNQQNAVDATGESCSEDELMFRLAKINEDIRIRLLRIEQA